jgi:hypothetical protein
MSVNTSDSSDSPSAPLLMDRVKFGVFFSSQISSLLCSFYLFFRFATRQNFRQSIHNHVIIVLICNSFIFVSVAISASNAFFFTSHVHPESDLFCAFWTWIHYSTDISNVILMCYACAERHWLVFRLNPLQRQRSRFLFHYIPIGICIIYPWLFYFVLIFVYPCASTYDYTQLLCSYPCYFDTKSFANGDTFANNWLPIAAIPVLSGALFVRFLAQKRRMQLEVFRWKRDQKMVIQLLTIASLYFLLYSPLQIIVLLFNYAWKRMIPHFVVNYFYVISYFVHLLNPFVVWFFNPELRRRGRIVIPQEHHQLQRIIRGQTN